MHGLPATLLFLFLLALKGLKKPVDLIKIIKPKYNRNFLIAVRIRSHFELKSEHKNTFIFCKSLKKVTQTLFEVFLPLTYNGLALLESM